MSLYDGLTPNQINQARVLALQAGLGAHFITGNTPLQMNNMMPNGGWSEGRDFMNRPAVNQEELGAQPFLHESAQPIMVSDMTMTSTNMSQPCVSVNASKFFNSMAGDYLTDQFDQLHEGNFHGDPNGLYSTYVHPTNLHTMSTPNAWFPNRPNPLDP
jgi:hypothetical protein